MTDLERYERAMKKISPLQMLNLPKPIKEALKNTKDLKTKAKLLEQIANNI